MDKMCLFCKSTGPFSVEHIIPESLGNDELLLKNEVCASCNNYFSKIEGYVLQKTPFAFWRTYLRIRSKKGQLPSVNFSQPDRDKGVLPSRHPRHADNVGMSAHEDGFMSLDVDNEEIIKSLVSESTQDLKFVMTPKMLHELGRFLCKVGVELLCLSDSGEARSVKYKLARDYARNGLASELWPIFYFSEGRLSDLHSLVGDEENAEGKICLFSCALLNLESEYTLFYLSVGTDNWVVCLNDKWPTPKINEAFPDRNLELIWYSPESYAGQKKAKPKSR